VAALASAFVAVRPDTAGFEPDLRRKLRRVDASKAGVSIGQSLGGGMRLSLFKSVRGMVGPLAAAFGAIKVGQLFGDFVSEARESQRVGKLTAQVIKTTGGAAKISAGQVGALATAISNKTGVDDEAIQSGANLLLTFKKVRNEVGAGNDIFNRATAAALDLSKAGFGDLSGTSKQLGKALNDPIKGMTALGRSGVTFTEQQKKQIKTLVESGHVLEAQKVILKEVESQVGGAAAATTNPMQKLGVIVDNLKERLGTAFLPVIDKAAKWLGRVLPEALDRGIAAAKGLFALFAKGDFTADLRKAFGVSEDSGFVDFLFRVRDAAIAAFAYFKAEVLPRLRDFGGYLTGTVVPAVADFGRWLVRSRDWLIPLAAGIGAIVVAMKIWTAVTKAFIVVQGVLDAVLTANPIGIVVLALVGLVTALVVAYKTSDTFRGIVQRAWAGIQAAVGFAWNNVIKPVFSALTAFVRTVLAPTVTWLWKNVIGPAFSGIAAGVKVYIAIVRGILQTLWAFIRNVIAPIFTWLWNSVVGPAFRGIASVISVVWTTKIKPILTTVGNFIRDKVAPGFRAGVTAIGKAWEGLKNAAKGPVNFVIGTVLNRGIFAAYNWVVRKFGGTEIPNLPLIGAGSGGRPTTAGLASGGTVPFVTDGPRAIVGEGRRAYPEYVIPTDPQHRRRAMDLYAELGTKMYADGGVIGPGFKAGLKRAASIVTANVDSDPTKWLTQKIAAALGAVGQSPFARMIMAIPRKIGSILVEKAKSLVGFGGSSPGLVGAVNYAKQIAARGANYLWGGDGPGGWDCSGWISTLVNIAQGAKNIFQRRFSTGTLPAGLFAPGPGAFNIGWFRGNPGHVAATINGYATESRGGDGVVGGSRSRGASYPYFTSHAHLKGFAAGGILPGDPPFDVLDRRGRYYQPGLLEALLNAKTFDSGGWLRPRSTTVVRNGTDQWEPVGPPGGGRTIEHHWHVQGIAPFTARDSVEVWERYAIMHGL
jgi:SLT domain-containing protein